jgi:hypothetical protein
MKLWVNITLGHSLHYQGYNLYSALIKLAKDLNRKEGAVCQLICFLLYFIFWDKICPGK